MFRKLAIVAFATLLFACTSQNNSQASEQAGDSSAQGASQGPQDLASLLGDGLLELVDARGNGASSGNSVDGVLRNTSGRAVKVDIVLNQPLYFRNGGRGQNMVGAMVVSGDGGYVSDGRNAYIEIPASRETEVSFVAYCADFDKDNPGPHEHFTIDNAPPELASVMDRIAAVNRKDPSRDIMVAAQVAVWLAQGISAEDISEKFEFNSSELALARELAGR